MAALRPLLPRLARSAALSQPRMYRDIASSARVGFADSAGDREQKKRVVVSGIQPTGIPHLGNYLGALKNWVDLQDTAQPQDELYFFIAGLHALTVPQNPKQLLADKQNLMATLMAIGLDPRRCTIFHQDEVEGHTELGWMLSCVAPFGKLERMTTWKSKLATLQENASEDQMKEASLQLGLFVYPVLQAADILLYRATHVPIGEDQVQHLELTRDLAQQFNKSVKRNFFRLPEYMITPAKRVLSLRNPEQKMSKSAPDANSRILLTDTPEQIAAKIRRAVTDSEQGITFDPEKRPGVSNLLEILAGLGGGALRDALQLAPGDADPHPSEVAAALERTRGQNSAALKQVLTESVVEALKPVQHEYKRLRNEPGYLEEMQSMGREKASARAAETMGQVRRLLGVQA